MDPWTRIKQEEEISRQRELKQTFTAASVKENGDVFGRLISGGQGFAFVGKRKRREWRDIYTWFGWRRDGGIELEIGKQEENKTGSCLWPKWLTAAPSLLILYMYHVHVLPL